LDNQLNILNEEDIFVIEDEENTLSSTSAEIPKEERHLRTQAYDKSVSDLVRMIRDGDIELNPDYQRNYIWDNKKASLLVESILLNIPIPVIYASEEEDSSWNIVDGLQRLYSLKRFFENTFKLSGLDVLQELNGFKYEDLPAKAKRILNNGIIRIILIFHDSHPEIKYDIFMRLNTGSVRLKAQELRNCLYRGNFNDLLKKLRMNKNLLKILKAKKPHKRMDDVELILRYFALSENYDDTNKKINNYKGKIKSFLNLYMNNNKNISDQKLKELENKFNNTIEKVYIIFGENAFRKFDNKHNQYDNKINRAIMDFIMISFEKHDKHSLLTKKELIIELFKNTLQEPALDDAITKGTSDTKRLEYRISYWLKKMQTIMGD